MYSNRYTLCGCWFPTPATQGTVHKSYLPSVELESHTLILAATSRTTLKQTFVNTTGNSLQEALYTFPLYDGVSVVDFRCTIKDKVLTGVVKEKLQARKDYDQAVEKGETAGLLEQLTEAADVFTTRIGNVPANEKILVEIVYLGELKHDAETDGSRFTVPTNIAPRYGSLDHDSTKKLTSPSANDSGGIRVSVDVALDSASVIQGLQSPSHPIAVAIGRTTTMPEDAFETNRASATLALQTTELDRDFILVVVSKTQGIPRALVETHPTISHQRAVMATLVPKFNLPSIIPEIVFVVDRSGSMGGKIATLVAAMKVFLKSLPVNGVKFNICSFGSEFSFLFKDSRTYDESSLEEALSHISSFKADFGGTEILPAIEAACNRRSHHMSLEVMVLTDGQIWNQDQLFEFIGKQKNARFFSLGIGAGASSSLVEGIARAGNGFSQFVGDNEKMDKRIVRMLKGALTPHIDYYTLTLKYSDTDDDDDFEMVEASSVKAAPVNDTPTEPTGPTGAPSDKIISLFDENVKEEPIKSVDKHESLPNITAPAVLQAPNHIFQLYPFQRTTVYLLLGPASPQKTPKSVLFSATSEHGRLELEIAIEDIGHGLSIHQLAAKRAVHELEQGRGWLAQAKSDSHQLLKDKYAARWDGIVERECVRLGTTFQVAGRYTSFVAVEKRNKQADTGGKEGGTAVDETDISTSLGLFGDDPDDLPLSAWILSRRARPAPAGLCGRGVGGAMRHRRILIEDPDDISFGSDISKISAAEPTVSPSAIRGLRGGGGGGGSPPVALRGAGLHPATPSNEDKMHQLIGLQRFDGSWAPTTELWTLVGLTTSSSSGGGDGDVGNKLEAFKQLLSKTSKNVDDVRATAVAIAWLEIVMAEEAETWEMVVDKARAWLDAALGGGDCDCDAAQAVGFAKDNLVVRA